MSVAMTQSTTTGPQQMMPHLDIVDRLRQIAPVHQAMELAEQSYAKIKSSNAMVERTLSQAEIMAEQLARPVLTVLEQPIQKADNLACQSFDKIQESVSVLSKNLAVENFRKRLNETLDLVQTNTKQARSMVDQTLTQARTGVEMVRKQASERIQSVMNVSETIVRSVDNSLTAAENALDKLLPASGDVELVSINPSTEPSDSLSYLIQRMVRFSDKLRRRLTHHTIDKWFGTAQESAVQLRENVVNLLSNYASSLRMLIDQQQRQEKPASKQD